MKIIKKYNQYIKGSLSEGELDSFTKEVIKDHFEKEELKDKWNQILQEEYQMGKPKKIFSLGNSKRLMKIGLSSAASILLLMLCWFAYQPTSLSTYEKLLSQELNKPYIETIIRKGSVEELKLEAAASYNNRDYSKAEEYFEELSQIDEAVDWDFYIGLCQLYQKQSDLAIKSFTSILDHPNKKYNIEANWYLGLAYTMNKDFDSAKKYLEFVANRSDDETAWKVKEARALLNALAEKE